MITYKSNKKLHNSIDDNNFKEIIKDEENRKAEETIPKGYCDYCTEEHCLNCEIIKKLSPDQDHPL